MEWAGAATALCHLMTPLAWKSRDFTPILFEGPIGNEKESQWYASRGVARAICRHRLVTQGLGSTDCQSWMAAASVDWPGCDTSCKKLRAQNATDLRDLPACQRK
jgi:hypothetical protein